MSEATEVVEAKPQDIATLPPADRAVIVMNSSKTEIQLRELVGQEVPAGDYMKEAERLLEQYDDACLGIIGMSEEQARAALLAHIQRGAVPEGWKEATIAWEVCASIHREYAKKKDPFFTTRQADFVRRTEAARAALLATTPDNFRDAAKMVAEPAEVPMPKPVAYGFGNTAITGHTNRLMMVRIDIPGGDQYAGAFWLPLVLADEAHTYGVACRAAGEAAGYARGLTAATMTQAATDVLAERQRQISAEGWTPEHDDEHDDGSLAAAAACYALGDQAGEIPAGWPQSWDESWWRPSAGERRNLVKAGALILAEIERLDRAALRGEVKP